MTKTTFGKTNKTVDFPTKYLCFVPTEPNDSLFPNDRNRNRSDWFLINLTERLPNAIH